MNKTELLKQIAEMGYNVGYGARKHFATYDTVNKIPGLISFLSITIGIFGLIFDVVTNKIVSASIVVFGIIGLYISGYESRKAEYEKAGIELIRLFNELSKLYKSVKSIDENEIPQYLKELENIENRFYGKSISKQILFSDWYAHYKFFWQFQIDWIDEQKNFKLLRDKLPLTFTLSIVISLILGVYFLTLNFFK